MTWQRYLAVLLGAHSAATAVVLAWFLGGLALGYAGFGALARSRVARATASGSRPRLLAVYAVAEAGIGLWSIAFPALFDMLRTLSLALPYTAGALSFATDALLAALLVAPPAALMGATIPLLTQALARDLEDATRWHALVYGSNTVGAFGGALAAGLWLLPGLGLVATLRLGALLNALAAAGFFLLDRMRSPAGIAAAPAPAPGRREPALAAAALLLGFAMMSVQTVLVRLGSLVLGPSQHTFSMVVAVFVLAIALGALAVALPRRISDAWIVAVPWALLVALAVLYAHVDAAPWGAHALRSLLRDVVQGFALYQGLVFLALLAVLAVPVALSGAALPLLFHASRREMGGLGSAAGRLYAWNTVGSLLGALLGGYALLYWLDLHHVFRVALGAVVGVAVLVGLRVARLPRAAAAALATGAAAGLVLLGPWSAERLSSGLFRMRQPVARTFDGPDRFFSAYAFGPNLFYDDDPVTSVAVREHVTAGGRRATSLITNGKGDGSLVHDYATMSLAALVPAVLVDRVERAFVIGWGTGVSAGELAALDDSREVVVAEISPAVVRAAPYFAHGNLDAAARPEVRIVVGDAYRTLQRSEGPFDVIVSEPSHPWAAGVEMLYTREFLEVARDRLAPGGVHTQWMHSYEIDAASLELVLRTYLDVFDDVSVWYGLGVDLLLLGHRSGEGAPDIAALEERMARPDFRTAFARVDIGSLPALLGHELLPRGVLGSMELSGELHTLLHPRLADRAARAFFVGASAPLPPSADEEAAEVGARESLVQRYLAYRGGHLSDAEHARLTRETCRHRARHCATLLGWWMHERPQSHRREALMAALIARPEARRKVRPDRVPRIAGLYDPEPRLAEGADALREAQRGTDLFYTHYHHAAPFPREHLEALWRACAADESRRELCARERRRAEEHLGPLEVASRPEAPPPPSRAPASRDLYD